MSDPYRSIDIKAFVPAKNYETSKQFYLDIGFSIASDTEGVAFVHHGDCSFLLQNYYVKECAENLMMHFQVVNVDDWHQRFIESDIAKNYGIKISEPTIQPWGMKDFTFHDPSGVLWRVGQNI